MRSSPPQSPNTAIITTTTNTHQETSTLITTTTVKQPPQQLPCPRCHSQDTKFCYYNNYTTSQPRHFCRRFRRHWTHGGVLRNIPVGGGTRKNTKRKNPWTPPHHHFGLLWYHYCSAGEPGVLEPAAASTSGWCRKCDGSGWRQCVCVIAVGGCLFWGWCLSILWQLI